MPGEEKKESTMLDAVNAALEEPKEPTTPEPEKEPDEESESEGEPEKTPEGEPEKKPEEKASEGGPEKKPEEKASEGGPEKKPEEKASEGEPEKKPEPKPLDPVNDPIPATVSERTRERITSLIGTVKQQAADLETQQELFKSVSSTGVTPENFANTLSFLRLYNSDQPAERKQALKFLTEQARELALELGETAPGVDPLEGHQDLIDAVAAQTASQGIAEETARLRNARKLQDSRQQQSHEQTQAWNEANTAAKAALNELGSTLKASDPLFEQKAAIVVPKIHEFCKTAHPSKWLVEFQKQYRDVKLPAAPTAPAAPASPQPLRANKQPTGEGKREPSSMLEAVTAALEK